VLLEVILKTGSIVTAGTGVVPTIRASIIVLHVSEDYLLPNFSMDELHVLVHVGQILAALGALALDMGRDNLIEVQWRRDQVGGGALGVGEARGQGLGDDGVVGLHVRHAGVGHDHLVTLLHDAGQMLPLLRIHPNL
jgi:hypothetical protein